MEVTHTHTHTHTHTSTYIDISTVILRVNNLEPLQLAIFAVIFVYCFTALLANQAVEFQKHMAELERIWQETVIY